MKYEGKIENILGIKVLKNFILCILRYYLIIFFKKREIRMLKLENLVNYLEKF